MTLALICLVCGLAGGLVIGQWISWSPDRGYVASVEAVRPWRVHALAEHVVEILREQCTPDQHAQVTSAVRSLVVSLRPAPLDVYRELGLHSSAIGQHGIAIIRDRVFVLDDAHWERRLARAILHVAHAAAFGTYDPSMEHLAWFAMVRNGSSLE